MNTTRTKGDAVNLAANALARTVLDAGATMTIRTGDTSATIGAVASDTKVDPLTDKPNERPRFIPPDEHFDEETGFLESRELEEIGAALVAHYPEFGFLVNADARIAFVWKRKGGKSSGHDVYGKCQKPSGLLKHYSACDYIVWIAADHVRESGWTNRQLEALIYHELKHAGYEIDEKTGEMKLTTIAHDAELFHDELKRYGAWNRQRERTGEVYAQIGLAATNTP